MAVITDSGGNSTKLWRSLCGIQHRDKKGVDAAVACPHSADALLQFFKDNLASVCAATTSDNDLGDVLLLVSMHASVLLLQ